MALTTMYMLRSPSHHTPDGSSVLPQDVKQDGFFILLPLPHPFLHNLHFLSHQVLWHLPPEPLRHCPALLWVRISDNLDYCHSLLIRFPISSLFSCQYIFDPSAKLMFFKHKSDYAISLLLLLQELSRFSELSSNIAQKHTLLLTIWLPPTPLLTG